MKIEMRPDITPIIPKCMNIHSTYPADSGVIYLNTEKENFAGAVSMPDGKNYTFRTKDGRDSVYIVSEYYQKQKVKEWEIDVSKVDAHHASYFEMYALAIHMDKKGVTKDFIFEIGGALDDAFGIEEDEKHTYDKMDYYQTFHELMLFYKKDSRAYKSYIELKHFFDFYDKEAPGVPSLLL